MILFIFILWVLIGVFVCGFLIFKHFSEVKEVVVEDGWKSFANHCLINILVWPAQVYKIWKEKKK